MSGHNKWSTIKRKKGANDAARAKVFTKIGRELAVAVKNGGPDPNNNAKLRDVIAKMLQMPATKIAQIESINKHLIPEFAEELKEGRLTFSAAYMISGMNEETQAEMLER